MLEKEFAQRYNTAQRNTHAPADLVEATRTLMDHAQKDENMSADTTEQRRPSARTAIASERRGSRPSVQKHHEHPRRTKRHRWMMPVAACLAALLVLFGIGSAVLPFAQQEPPVRAYAKTPNLLTAEMGDGVMPFAIDAATEMQGWRADKDSEGSYSGMVFSIEGDGISSVQATISRGELYCVTTETYDRTTAEGRAIIAEAASWKPAARGTGDHLSEYDYVTMHHLREDLDRLDPEQQVQLRLIKRYGSTVDVPYKDEPLTFGLWFDGLDELANGLPDLYALDGTELTITAAYTDGTFRTQKMTLHDGYFKVIAAGEETQEGQMGADEVMAEGPFTNRELKQKYDPNRVVRKVVHTLYGEVTSITDQPHPYPLDNANEHANAPVEAMSFEDELGFTPSTGITTIEGVPASENVRPLSDDFANGQWSYERNGWADLRWSDVSVYLTDTLPATIDLRQNTEVWAFQGNIAYLNKWRILTNHWTVDENGRVNDDNSFVVLDVTVTNAEDEEVMFSGRDVRGTMCAVNDETGETLLADGGLFGAADELGRTWGHGGEDSFILGPHESLRLHMAFIADNTIAEADDVLFTLTSRYEFEPYHGRTRADLDTTEFISLGKLDRH